MKCVQQRFNKLCSVGGTALGFWMRCVSNCSVGGTALGFWMRCVCNGLLEYQRQFEEDIMT
jgi:hypothetical protein